MSSPDSSSTSWQTTLQRLHSLARLGVRPGLERLGLALERLGAPERSFRALHLAGTNGKGSTAAFLAACLRAAGYRTGLYTSPHLCRFSERIQIDGAEISGAEAAAGLDRLLAVEPQLTFFEAATGLAFSHFASRQVEVAVIETGLGGRLDATNLVRPEVSLLTRIDLDHLEIIGPDLASVAREKAGIIKPGVPAVSAPAVGEVKRELLEASAAAGASLLLAGDDFSFRREQQGLTVEGPRATHRGLQLSLSGDHQLENAALCVVALELLARSGLRVSEAALRQGLASTRWPGRLERIGRVLLDGAHNGNGARALAGFLRGSEPATMVLGLLGPKDRESVLWPLRPRARRFIFTRPRSPRALDPAELLPLAGPVPAEVCGDLEAALLRAQRSPEPIVIAGSLYLVGEARALLLGERRDPVPTMDPIATAAP